VELFRIRDAIDRAVVTDQQRSVLHDRNIGGTADIFVILDEARDERLDRFHRAVLVELGDNNIAADLLRAVPRAVARDENLVLVLLRKHAAV